MLARLTRTVTAAGDEMTPAQLLERLGFTSAQLQTPVRDLSGGQRRRLQLLLILLDEPNVLILDEPTNDVDSDMLAAMEDLLDSWPGTLIVVSHDRYLLERVTDQQYAIFDRRLRHLPGGVDEYLALRRRAGAQDAAAAGLARVASATGAGGGADAAAPAAAPAVSGAERRALEKEMQSIERRLGRLREDIAGADARLAEADQSDFEALAALGVERQELADEVDELELRWLEAGELLEG